MHIERAYISTTNKVYQSHDFNGTPSSFALNVHNYIQEIRTKMKNIKIMIKKDIMIPNGVHK